jgi:hypothetical protein
MSMRFEPAWLPALLLGAINLHQQTLGLGVLYAVHERFYVRQNLLSGGQPG